MIGRLFGKPRKRISPEEFGRVLADFAQRHEATLVSGWWGVAGEESPDPVGVSLVSASAVVWSAANNRFLQGLTAERFSALTDAYYVGVWEGMKSRFGAERTPYDEFVWRLGGMVLPDSVKSEWALRSGVHDVLDVAVRHIGHAADEFLAASGSDESSAKAVALGDAVSRVLLGHGSQESAKVAMSAYSAFTAVAKASGEFLQELESQGVQVV